MANRLSADPARRVLLIEAGKAYAPNAYPDIVRRQDMLSGDAAHDWGFASTPGVIGRSIPLNRGKVLGGTRPSTGRWRCGCRNRTMRGGRRNTG